MFWFQKININNYLCSVKCLINFLTSMSETSYEDGHRSLAYFNIYFSTKYEQVPTGIFASNDLFSLKPWKPHTPSCQRAEALKCGLAPTQSAAEGGAPNHWRY